MLHQRRFRSYFQFLCHPNLIVNCFMHTFPITFFYLYREWIPRTHNFCKSIPYHLDLILLYLITDSSISMGFALSCMEKANHNTNTFCVERSVLSSIIIEYGKSAISSTKASSIDWPSTFFYQHWTLSSMNFRFFLEHLMKNLIEGVY